jgi:hypothetical protein
MNPQSAWQPLTPAGVANFAHATFARLILVQLAVALLTAGTVVWFVSTAYYPSITSAIDRLPSQGGVSAGVLTWTTNSPITLAESRFLAIAVDLEGNGSARSPAHIQLEFGKRQALVLSLLGFWPVPYGPSWVFPLNRAELEPWWGAWAIPILGVIFLGTVVWLFAAWLCLATLYTPPVWLIGFFANRELSLTGSWRLAGAALMPGALFGALAILCYGLGVFDPLRLAVALAVHLVIGWAFICIAPFWVQPLADLPSGNPFRPEPEASKSE